MFKDYYAILEIHTTASLTEIKTAYRLQAIKWHPDKNIGKDTSSKMQVINEAYLILKDIEARKLYDSEIQKFKIHQSKAESKSRNQEEHFGSEPLNNENRHEYSDYNIENSTLKKWMTNAKNQAVNLASESIQDVVEMTIVGVKAASKEAYNTLINYIIFTVLIVIILIIITIIF